MLRRMHAFDLTRLGGPGTLEAIVGEVRAAGAEARAIFEASRGAVETKPDRSPVTAADRAVETRLRAFLEKTVPDASFLGEETGASGARGASLEWLVDPIDGTRAFVRGLTTWSVLVALLDEGEPAVGIAYLPGEDDLYVAVRGAGATRNGAPLRVSGVTSLSRAMVSHGALAQFSTDALGRALLSLRGATDGQRGLADFDGHRNVARGRIDAMIDPGVQPWDVAAAALVVREAGGRWTTLRGSERLHDVVRDGGALTSNGLVHDALLETLAAAGV